MPIQGKSYKSILDAYETLILGETVNVVTTDINAYKRKFKSVTGINLICKEQKSGIYKIELPNN